MEHLNVTKYKAGYPTIEQAKRNPMLLKNTPERWKSIAFVCTVLSTMSLTACTQKPTEHFEGLISQPKYNLSEEEAIQVILDEAMKYGVEFDSDNKKELIAEMPTGVTYDYSNTEFDYSVKNTKILVDGTIKDKNISFEYLSINDVFEWSDYYIFYREEIMDGFLKKYIGSLKDNKLKTDDDHIIGAFYIEPAYSKGENEEDLRKQVKAFIEMLKEQGVI